MLFSLIEHVKGRNPDVEGCGLITCVFSGSLCRFPQLVLSRLGSRNIDFLFEYSEANGIHYPCSALHIENANFFLVHALSSFRNSLDPLPLPGM
jgi:hypothetical protein